MARCLTQMDLSLDIDVSTRHLSFVETGKSNPSANLLMVIAERLEVPLRTRNQWLLAAGYAPRYSELGLEDKRMGEAKIAIQRLLDAHSPYPGVALDGKWDIVLHNEAAGPMIALLPEFLRSPRVNMFRASLHPEGFARHTTNFAVWGRYLMKTLQRLRLSVRDENLEALADEVGEYPGVKDLTLAGDDFRSGAKDILVPCELQFGTQQLSLFTTLTTFGSPRDITLEELCIELFYPADAQTAGYYRSMMQTG